MDCIVCGVSKGWTWLSDFYFPSPSHTFYPMDCSPPGSYLHGILQARIPEWLQPFPSPGDLPKSGMELGSPALQADSSPSEPPGKPKNTGVGSLPFSRGSSWPRNQTRISCIAGGFFTSWATREAPSTLSLSLYVTSSEKPSLRASSEASIHNCWSLKYTLTVISCFLCYLLVCHLLH